METLARLFQHDEGVTTIEYSLIAGLVGVAIVAGASALGDSLSNLYIIISNCVSSPSTCIRI